MACRCSKGLIEIKNEGKIFEQQWKKSIPDYALLFRLHDAAQSFSRSKDLRFSSKNPFDYILFDSDRRILYALELKTVKGKSIPFERDNEKKSSGIHLHQIEGLKEWDHYPATVCGFVIEFRQIEKTVFIDVKELLRLIELIPKKSFSFDDLNKYGISYIMIAQKKARTRFTYDVDGFLAEIK